MNNDVFFVVEPITAQNPFSLSHFLIAIFCSILIYIIFCAIEKFLYKKKITKNIAKNLKTEKIEYIFPEISDKNFNEKIFILLQNFVREKYLPKNALAHTFSDITNYCNNKKILSTYKNLEEKIFKKEISSNEEKTFYLDSIHEIIHKNTK